MKVTRIRYVHDMREDVTDKWGHPLNGAGSPTRTIALRGREDGKIEVGVALCHPNDQFSRRAGRIVSAGRLEGQAQRHFYIVDNHAQLLDENVDTTTELEFCFSLVVRDIADSRFVEPVEDKVCL